MADDSIAERLLPPVQRSGSSRTPWGPWSEPQVLFTAHDGAKFMHNPRADPADGLAGPVIGKPEKDWTAEYAGAYAPYVVERFTKVVESELHLYYCLSTWNPYVRGPYEVTFTGRVAVFTFLALRKGGRGGL